VSSLDTPHGTWAEIQRRVSSDLDIPGRCYGRLIDGTTLLIDRSAMTDFGESSVLTTRPISYVARSRQRLWNFDDEAAASVDHGRDFWATWQWLIQLHHVLLGR
jgi:hypothetical protein